MIGDCKGGLVEGGDLSAYYLYGFKLFIVKFIINMSCRFSPLSVTSSAYMYSTEYRFFLPTRYWWIGKSKNLWLVSVLSL